MTSKTTERDGHSKTVTDASSVRLSVRLRSNENKEENLRIYVQHYQKPANARLKRIDPSPLDAKGVELSVLDNEAIYLDFPEVTAKVVQQHRHVSGNKLYGFIVSIYDKNGEILYQASPVSSLRNIAKPQEPAFSGMDLRGAEANFVENNNNKPENELPQAAIRISEGPLSDARKRFFRALNAHRANPQNQKLKDEYDEALKAFHHARANAE
ncbi:hypothetical protein H8D64_00300 [PVC group bacterium]|nr:hypothetical protein [PVC group bacterium]